MKNLLQFILHLLYWVVYGTLIFFYLLTMKQMRWGQMPNPTFNDVYLLFTCVPAVLGFYLFYTFAFTSLLKKQKYLLLLFAAPSIALFAGIVSAIFIEWRSLNYMFHDGWQSFWEETITMSFLALIHGCIALVLHGFVDWFADTKLKAELAEKNFSMELALIKAHIHPHFLFNTLNNIDVLVEKDAALASKYIHKLSDILRFMLFDTKPEHIPLQKELTYIEEYIDLQRLRAAHPDYVHFSIKGDVNLASVPPMLFIPFIENAFTHSEAHKAEPAVRIAFDVTSKTLDFICENKFSAFQANKKEVGGLGLPLMEKRLNLLYPQKHTLTVEQTPGLYKVHLTLQLA